MYRFALSSYGYTQEPFIANLSTNHVSIYFTCEPYSIEPFAILREGQERRPLLPTSWLDCPLSRFSKK